MATQPTPEITGDEILGEYAPLDNDVSLSGITGLQRLGGRILFAIFIISVLAVIVIMIPWLINIPKVPTIPVIQGQGADTAIANTQKMLDFYKLANEIAAEQPLEWFKVFVAGLLYPLATLVLGYIFGTNNSSNNNNNPG